MIGLGRVPPRFDMVFKSCKVSFRVRGGCPCTFATHGHVCSADQGVCDLSVECGDTNELYRARLDKLGVLLSITER